MQARFTCAVLVGILPMGASLPCVHGAPLEENAPAKEDASTGTRSTPPANRASERSHARVFFNAGIALYRQARYAEALKSFQQALAIFDSPVFVFNLARTCDRVGDVACALHYYRDYRNRDLKTEDMVEVSRRIRTLEADLEARGSEVVVVTSSPAGASLFLDGLARGPTPWLGELPLGDHALRLELSGYSDEEATLHVERGQGNEHSYELREPAPIPPPVSQLEPPPHAREGVDLQPSVSGEVSPGDPGRRRISAWTYATLGAAVVALGSALAFEILSRRSEQEVREAAVQLDRVAAYDAMNQRQTTARVLAGVGAGLTALGVTFLVLDLRAPAPAAHGPRARVGVRGDAVLVEGIW